MMHIIYYSHDIQYSSLSHSVISSVIKLLTLRMLKQVIAAFELNSCLVFCCSQLDCNDIYDYLTQIDEKAFHEEINIHV